MALVGFQTITAPMGYPHMMESSNRRIWSCSQTNGRWMLGSWYCLRSMLLTTSTIRWVGFSSPMSCSSRCAPQYQFRPKQLKRKALLVPCETARPSWVLNGAKGSSHALVAVRRYPRWGPLIEALVKAPAAEIGELSKEDRAKRSFAENDDVVQAFASHTTKKSFHH